MTREGAIHYHPDSLRVPHEREGVCYSKNRMQEKGMTEDEKNTIRGIILAETARLKQDVEALKEVTKPVAPEDMDDITRMDAIVNKSVNDAALAAAKSRLAKLEYAGKRLDDPEFGYCVECGETIPVKRLLAMPESTLCVDCAE